MTAYQYQLIGPASVVPTDHPMLGNRVAELVEPMPTAVFIIDVLQDDYRVAALNALHVGITQIRDNIGLAMSTWLPQEVFAQVKANYDYAISQRSQITYDEYLTLAGGDTWWRTHLMPLFTPDGHCPRIIGSAMVINAQVRAERALAVSTAKLKRLATTDHLTGLPNRREYMNRLSQTHAAYTRNQRPYTVALLDLDGFKAINDTHGHAAGDAVLGAMAALFGHTLRPSDLAARIGGDEFAILLADTTAQQAATALDRLLAAFIAQFPNAPRSFSAGVAQISAAQTTEQLLRAADKALYRIKNAGGGGVEQHRP
jgi:diguanylate cyclase (GGDEF)-like protein